MHSTTRLLSKRPCNLRQGGSLCATVVVSHHPRSALVHVTPLLAAVCPPLWQTLGPVNRPWHLFPAKARPVALAQVVYTDPGLIHPPQTGSAYAERRWGHQPGMETYESVAFRSPNIPVKLSTFSLPTSSAGPAAQSPTPNQSPGTGFLQSSCCQRHDNASSSASRGS
ncbi:hypothetical protein VTI28DRAFT_2101 [Corynascus sepedonium]